MRKPKLIRILIMDCIDFIAVVFPSVLMAYWNFIWHTADLENIILGVGPEIILEAVYLVPEAGQMFIAASVMTSVVYQVFFLSAFGATLGAKIMGLEVISRRSNRFLTPLEMVFRGFGSAIFVFFFFIGPLYAWWLDKWHQGGGDFLAKSRVVVKFE